MEIGNSKKISGKHLVELKNWFYRYVDSFIGDDKILVQNVELKKVHTSQVCKNIIEIGRSLNLNNNWLIIAEIIALFHDIGRFEQFKIYRTFLDSKSIDHGEFGVEVLKNNKVLNILEKPVRELIQKAIKYHNYAFLPNKENEECIFFTKLIRDADKLDIYRVVTKYYDEMEKGQRNKSIELDLPDTSDISEKVYSQIMEGSIVNINDIRNLNDFKILQMGWVFDINFPCTFHRIKLKKYLDLISRTIPKTDSVNKVLEIIYLYFEEKCVTC